MRTLTRFTLATTIALSLLLTAASLLAYARTTSVPVPEKHNALSNTDTVLSTHPSLTATVTLESAADGKPGLSVGTPVDNVIFAEQVRAAAPDEQAVEMVGAAAAAPVQDPILQDEPVVQPAGVASFSTLADQQIAIVEQGGKPPLLRGTVVTDIPFVNAMPEAGSARALLQESTKAGVAAAGDATTSGIDMWYGANQKFGNVGKPQIEINILGTVLTPTGRISATYSLNGGAEQPLSLGPDKRRLAQQGDFNAEINFSELITGGNTVQITATDHLSTTTSQVVSVNYTPGNSWPINYVANWATAGGSIQNLAQVIDGEWALEGGSVRPVVLNYDRLIGIGEVTWSDYEVVVPVTIHGIDENGFPFPSSGPGVGLLLKWQGHYNRSGEQPDEGWRNFGALGWYRWSRASEESPIIAGMQMLAYRGNEVDVNPNEVPTFGTTYMMKMSVQSQGADKPAYYRFKTWPANQPEPAVWDMETSGIKDEPTTGSLLLVSHHVDATFGTVTVRPLSTITSTIQTEIDGNGSISIVPSKESYSYGEEVQLVATSNSGYVFEQWGGDVSGTETPLRVKVTQDLSVTAKFVVPTPSTVSASAQGSGQVKISPQKASYAYDELVTLTALADPGFQFTGWSGSIIGVQNPVTLRMREDVTVTAGFEASAAPPISDDFRTCRLDESLWTPVDPKGDSSITVNGQQLVISVPANSDHDLFTNKNFAPRILQSTPDTDFVVEVRFESPLTQKFQTQGIIIEQDENDLLRWEFYSNGAGTFAYAAVIEDGTATPRANNPVTIPNGAPMYMRVSRSDDLWAQEYSFDGQNWTTNINFEYAMAVARSGVYGGNVDPTAGEPDTSPAHTAIIDYFFNTAARIDPEDGEPLSLTVNVNPVGSGSVAKSPDKPSYGCDEAITLTATADEGFQFGGWSGAVTSGENPLTGFTLRDGDTITATFIEEITDGVKIYLPIVNR